jgi:hypothetical protein
VLDTLIANVSFPAIAGDLGVSPDQGATALLFLLLVGVIWLARPTSGQAPSGLRAPHTDCRVACAAYSRYLTRIANFLHRCTESKRFVH